MFPFSNKPAFSSNNPPAQEPAHTEVNKERTLIVEVEHGNRLVRAYFEKPDGSPGIAISLSKFTHGGRWTMNFSDEIEGLDLVSCDALFVLYIAAAAKVKEIDPEWNVAPEEVMV